MAPKISITACFSSFFWRCASPRVLVSGSAATRVSDPSGLPAVSSGNGSRATWSGRPSNAWAVSRTTMRFSGSRRYSRENLSCLAKPTTSLCSSRVRGRPCCIGPPSEGRRSVTRCCRASQRLSAVLSTTLGGASGNDGSGRARYTGAASKTPAASLPEVLTSSSRPLRAGGAADDADTVCSCGAGDAGSSVSRRCRCSRMLCKGCTRPMQAMRTRVISSPRNGLLACRSVCSAAERT